MVIQSGKNWLPDAIGFIVIVLMAVGTIFVFSASASVTSDIDWRRFYESPNLRQIFFFPVAVAILFIASRFDYKKFALTEPLLKSASVCFLVVSIILLALVLSQRVVPFLHSFIPKVNQHYRWLKIPLGPMTMSFQPSELAKWAVVFFLSGACIKYADTLHQFKQRFVPLCGVVGAAVFLIVIEDLGTAAFLSLLAFLILALGGAKWKHLLIPVPFILVGFLLILLLYPERMQRITSFLHPAELSGSSNYQASQSLIAVGSGGAFGKGLGKGICKYGHLPEDTTDFIFAIIGEELGFAGTTVVIILFITFVILAASVVRKCNDPFGKLLATGIVLAIGLQAVINIGVVTVVLPTKGIPLPFVSAGGTGMLLAAAAVGVLLNIAKSQPAAWRATGSAAFCNTAASQQAGVQQDVHSQPIVSFYSQGQKIPSAKFPSDVPGSSGVQPNEELEEQQVQ
jgi:cell division protein FtsW